MVNALKFEKTNKRREEEYAAKVLADCQEVKCYKLSQEQLATYLKLRVDPFESKPSVLAKVTSMTKGTKSNVMRKNNYKRAKAI
jgi:hypothetical protein